MPFVITYNKDCSYIKVSIEGELNLEVLQNIAKEVDKIAQSNGCDKILNDLQNAIVNISAFEIYQMPQMAKTQGIKNWYKRALVVGERREDFAFLETVFLNQGHLVRLFESEDSAHKWLMQK